MFRVDPKPVGQFYRWGMVALSTLSVAALIVTLWIMVDFRREQRIVRELMVELPSTATASAEQLVDELRWQSRLTILVVLNSIATFGAALLLWRAFRSSQETLRDIQALAGDILGSVEQAVITTDPQGLITSINEPGIHLLEVEGDMVGQPLRKLSDRMPLEEFRVRSRGSSSSQHEDFPLGDHGDSRVLRGQCQRLQDRAGCDIGDVLQLRDVTKRQLIEKRMRSMERYMGLGSLASGLHHEIKNPLAAVSLHVQLLEEQLDDQETSDEVREMLTVVNTEMARIGRVLESFRDFAELDHLAVVKVNAADLVHRQVRLISPQATRSNIDVSVSIPDEPLPSLWVDDVKLEQVFMNLFVNALEAMPRGGSLHISIHPVNAPIGESLSIQIADTGTGIPEAFRKNIMDPYFTTKNDGTGMGLAFSDKVIRQHNGALDFHCTATGTTFEITIPIDSSRAKS